VKLDQTQRQHLTDNLNSFIKSNGIPSNEQLGRVLGITGTRLAKLRVSTAYAGLTNRVITKLSRGMNTPFDQLVAGPVKFHNGSGNKIPANPLRHAWKSDRESRIPASEVLSLLKPQAAKRAMPSSYVPRRKSVKLIGVLIVAVAEAMLKGGIDDSGE
jgi:hypothetical protein